MALGIVLAVGALGTSSPAWSRTLGTGDFNEDGIPDRIILERRPHQMTILLGDGSGGFSAHGHLPAGSRTRFCTVDDFDGDGHLDIEVTRRRHDRRGLIFFGDGSGTFGLREDIVVQPAGAPR